MKADENIMNKKLFLSFLFILGLYQNIKPSQDHLMGVCSGIVSTSLLFAATDVATQAINDHSYSGLDVLKDVACMSAPLVIDAMCGSCSGDTQEVSKAIGSACALANILRICYKNGCRMLSATELQFELDKTKSQLASPTIRQQRH